MTLHASYHGTSKKILNAVAWLLMASLCLVLWSLILSRVASATGFTTTVPGTAITIPSTYPQAGGVVIVLEGLNGNVYYQFSNPSTMFQGYQNTGSPTAWRGNPFQVAPTTALNCGFSSCSTYLGGGITRMSVRFTAYDGDSQVGMFDYNDLTLRINGFDVANWSNITSQNTDTAGTTLISNGVGFGNNTFDTGWFQSTNAALLSNVLSTGNLTSTVFDADPNDNFWDFKRGNDANSSTVPLTVAPGVTIDKASTTTSFSGVGQVVPYTFTITNIGSVWINPITVSDPKISGVICPGPPVAITANLDPGEAVVCTGSYTTIQADVDAGVLNNTATARGTPQAGSLGPVTDTNSIPGPVSAPSVVLNKVATPSPFGVVGSTVNYSFTVQNTGNVTLTNVNIADPLLPTLSCTTVAIAPGATVPATCSNASKTVTQADVDAASIVNTATVSARAPNGATVTDPVTITTAGPARSGSIALTKIAGSIADTNGNGRQDVGDTLSYGFAVTNTGNVTLTAVTVTDPKIGVTVAGSPIASLAPGAVNSSAYTASYVLTQADMNAGTVVNQASVSATPPSGVSGPIADLSHPTSNGANANTIKTITQVQSLSIDKTTPASSFATSGETIAYAYVVTNTGTVTLTTPVTVSDNKITGGNTVTCAAWPVGGLAPAATLSCSASYTVLQSDIDAGSLTNTATASSGATISAPDAVTLPAATAPGIAVVKAIGTIADTNSSGRTDVGDTLTWAFTVSNTGNVTLTGVTVTDPKIGVVVSGGPLSLAPGVSNSASITATYVLTQADITAGAVTNQATATGTPPTGPNVTDTSHPSNGAGSGVTTTPIPQVATLAIVKSVGTIADTNSSGRNDVGDTMTWPITVTNTGTVPLTAIAVTDSKPGVIIAGSPIASLAPGAVSSAASASYVLTQADLDAGTVANQAAASGSPPTGPPATDTSDPSSTAGNATTNTPVTQTSSIAVVKSAGTATTAIGTSSDFTDAGDTLTYSFSVTNTGAVTLTSIGVTDPKVTNIVCAASTLAPGVSTICSGDVYILTLADMNNGSVSNQATASGTPPTGPAVTDPSGTATNNNLPTVKTLTQTPRIGVVKTSAAPTISSGASALVTDAGDSVSYSFTISNLGSVTLSSVSLSDPKLTGMSCVANTLTPGSTTTCSASPLVLAQSDMDAGSVSNQATASGLPPTGPAVTDTSDESTPGAAGSDPTVTPLTQTSSVALLKSASAIQDYNGNGLQDAGDRITYAFTVTNTGAVTLTNITINDPGLIVSGATLTTLAPGASNSTRFTAIKTLMLADINAGSFSNQATVSAVAPTGTITDISDPSSIAGNAPTIVTIAPVPSLSLQKSSTTASFAGVGDIVAYEYLVRNTGNITLTNNVTVADDKTSVICPAGNLLPNATLTCSATYSVTQADIDAGGVTNTASASSGASTSPNDVVTVPAIQDAKMIVTKSSSFTGALSAGLRADYTYEVTNTGNTTLIGPFTVTDNLIDAGSLSCDAGPLAPGDRLLCVGTYRMVPDDVALGRITNLASVSNGSVTTPQTTATIPIASNPALMITKTSPTTGFDNVGDRISYEFEIENTGDATLVEPITVADTINGVTSSVACWSSTGGDPEFNIGDRARCSLDYYVTQQDVDRGFVDNQANAETTFAGGAIPVVSAPDDLRIIGTQDPQMTVTKAAAISNDLNSNTTIDLGDTLTYTISILNSGDTTLSNINVVDPLIPSLSCTIASLAPTLTDSSCVGTYAVTQADVDAGTILNSATASGVTPQGASVSNSGSLTTTLPPVNGSLSLVKTSNIDPIDAIGQEVIYSFAVQNTGVLTLTNVTVTDPLIPLFTCVIPTLLPGDTDSTSCNASYIVTQADVDNGGITNIASVTASTPRGTAPTAQDDITIVGPAREPFMVLNKSVASGPTVASGALPVVVDAGDTLGYEFALANTGNVTITSVVLTDAKCAATPIRQSGDTNSNNILDVGEIYIYGCTSVPLTLAELNAGSVDNTATATGTPLGGILAPAVDTVSTDLTQTPAISVVKSAGTLTDVDSNGPDLGDTIVYTFAVANEGSVTLTGVSVTDAKVGSVACPTTTLVPGDSTDCTATYTLTLADFNTGSVTNTATASGAPPSGPNVSDVSGGTTGDDTPTVTALSQSPAIAVVKTAGAPTIALGSNSTITDVGDTIGYSFVVSNQGNVTLTSVGVTDAKIGTVSCPVASLTPGDSTTCTGSYTLLLADLNSGSVTNTATAVGTPPLGVPVSDVSGNATNNDTPTITTLTQTPAIAVVKTAAAPTVALGAINSATDAGDTIAYSFVITNTGSVSLSSVGINDPLFSPVTCLATALDPGVTTNCSGSYTLTLANMNTGSVTNQATATGTPPTGPAVTDLSGTSNGNDASTITNLPQTPSIAIIKTAGAPTVNLGTNTSFTDAGDTVSYSFAVTNTGTITLNSVGVTDAKVSGITCGATSLAPGANTTCSGGNYILTQADLDAGLVTNQATASGTPPTGPAVTDLSGSSNGNNTATTTAIPQSGSIVVVKSAGVPTVVAGSQSSVTDAGDTIAYSFDVTNTGTLTLTSVSILDAKVGSVICSSTTLAPSVSTTCTASYTLALADMNAGSVTNTATASGQLPSGGTVSDISGSAANNDTATVTSLTQTPAITVVKTAAALADGDGNGADEGDTIDYSFDVTNIGTVSLNSVGVTDAKIGTVLCPVTSLAPTVSTLCTATYTLTQADVDTGSVTNQATASGTPPTGPAVTDLSDESTPGSGANQNDPTISLIPQSPSIAVVKTAGAVVDGDSNGTDAGDTILYSFAVTNTGNVNLTTVGVTDAKVGVVFCPVTSLAPGVSTVCTATYTLTIADLNTGSVTNQATASGTPPIGAAVTDQSGGTVGDDIATITGLTQSPSITVIKTAAAPTVNLGSNSVATDAGDTIAYSFNVENTGNVTLTGVAVTDVKVGAVACPVTMLIPGASTTCTANYTLNLTDMNVGSVTNSAEASGIPPFGAAVTDDSDESSPGTGVGLDDSTVTTLNQTAAVTLVKSAGVPTVTAGVSSTVTDENDTIDYSFVVTNSGTVSLSNIGITDAKVGAVLCPLTALDPGDSTTCTATYTVALSDMNVGSVTNTATVGAEDPSNNPVSDVSGTADNNDTPTVRSLSQVPTITVVKTAAAPTVTAGADATATDVGDTVDYSFDVTNTGTVSLTSVGVTDAKVGAVTCPVTALDPGLSTTCTATHTIALTDMNAGEIENQATASGTPPTGPAVTDLSDESSQGSGVGNDDATVTQLTQTARLTLVKTAGIPTVAAGLIDSQTDAGDTIAYSFLVENTGNVTLNDIAIADAKIATVTCPVLTLDPGTSTTCSASYTLLNADLNAGSVTNTATVTAKDPGGASLSDVSGNAANNDTPTVSALTPFPAIAVVKTAATPSIALGASTTSTDAGDTIAYSFVVSNVGTVTLTSVGVSDVQVGAVTCPELVLAPSDSTTCTASYTLSQADMNAGEVTNSATASGTPPVGAPVSDISGSATNNDTPTVTALTQTSAVSVVKAAGEVVDVDDNGIDVDDTIAYLFNVSNSGTVSLNSVAVSDAKVANIVCAATTLEPGVATTCAGDVYVLTQSDVDAGTVENTATASGVPPASDANPTPLAVTDISDESATGTGTGNDDPTVTILNQAPAITLVKTAAAPTVKLGSSTTAIDAGDTIAYRFAVANSGNVTLSSIAVADAKVGTVVCPVTTLAPLASTICTASYVLTLADLNAGSVSNSASATGTPPSGDAVADLSDEATPGNGDGENDPTVSAVAQVAQITLVKTAGAPTLNKGAVNDVPDVGDTIPYSFKVTNSGSVTLNNIVVDDNKVSAVICPATTLIPGASLMCSAIYSLSQSDLNVGTVENTATASGTSPAGSAVSDVSGVGSDNDDPTITAIPKISKLTIAKAMVKELDKDGSGFVSLGDDLTYVVTATNAGNVTQTNVVVTDLKIDPPSKTCATLQPQATCVLKGVLTVSAEDVAAGGVKNTAQVKSDLASAGVEASQFTPAFPLVRKEQFTKVSGVNSAKRGERVPYVITVQDVPLSPARIDDIMPAGFTYVTGSATVNGVGVEPVLDGQRLRFDGLVPNAEGDVRLALTLLASTSSTTGPMVNVARLINPATGAVLATARATVSITAEPVFDCGEIIGKVFDDRNRNGVQDAETSPYVPERGLPGVRLATVKGVLVTTDKNGRFSIACADIPDGDIGSNFIVKLDPRTLPTGYRITTENPRKVRLTRGKVTKLNFGAAMSRVVTLDLNGKVFEGNTVKLKAQWLAGIDQLIAALEQEPSTLRINYEGGKAVAAARMRAVTNIIEKRWAKKRGRYRLSIETRNLSSQGKAAQ